MNVCVLIFSTYIKERYICVYKRVYDCYVSIIIVNGKIFVM